MDNNKLVLGALAMDLKRVALGLHQNSKIMAGKFTDEALRRREELINVEYPEYINKLLNSLENATKDAESALMYSTLFQNYIIKSK